MVNIITDSATEFENEDIERLNITCVPIQISFGDKTFKENEDMSKADFYNMLKSCEDMPKTSQPSIIDYENAMKKAMDKGEETVVITISSELSGTYQSVNMVKELLEYSDCYVVDSLNATCGQRILAEYAVKLRDEGKNAAEIVEELEKLKKRITVYACIDTLKYLYKGGRISKTEYSLASFANIKPVIAVSEEGKIIIPQKVISMQNGIRCIVKKMTEEETDTDFPIYVLYAGDITNAEKLFEKAKKSGFDISRKNLINIGAAIGSHIGTGACGIVYVRK